MKTYMYQLFILLACVGNLAAQVPQGFQYQAVIRDNTGNPLLNTSVQFRFTLENNAGNQIFYQETQSISTNALGGISLVIGAGNPSQGNFALTNWKSGDVRLRVELDPAGGNNYAAFGITSLQSVPYALYAERAGVLVDQNGNDWGPENDQDAQTLIINGNQLSISNGNAVVLPSGSGGGDNWGTQTIETESELTGNGTLSSPLGLATQGADNGDILKWNGISWVPAQDNSHEYAAGNGISIIGDVINNTGDNDNNPTNEIQTLSINGQVLSLTDGGSVNIPAQNYTEGTGISITGNTIAALNSTNLWNANQLQNRSIATTAPTNGQVLKYNGSTWSPAADNGQSYTEGTGINIAGSIISAENTNELWNANQLRSFNIVDQAPLDGQVLRYVSTAGGWLPQNSSPTYWVANGNNIYYNSGNVGFGVTVPLERLHINGTDRIRMDDETFGKFGSNSIEFSSHLLPLVDDNRSLGISTRRWTSVWATDGTINTSDAREKKNINPLQYGLADIMKLKPVSFEWDARNDGKIKLGLLAQDLEEVIPEVIARPTSEDPEGTDRLGVYYSDLIPVLVKAIQEQEAKILQLQQEIELLKKN